VALDNKLGSLHEKEKKPRFQILVHLSLVRRNENISLKSCNAKGKFSMLCLDSHT